MSNVKKNRSFLSLSAKDEHNLCGFHAELRKDLLDNQFFAMKESVPMTKSALR
jgi:hypothetical protein